MRVGIGYDSHRFAPGRPLILGGVTIPHSQGLTGHSDGDAVCHALTDAILGAAGLGDIGEMFSDKDPANKGRDSVDMLALAVSRAKAKGYRVVQVDVTVVTESPRLSAHKDAMGERLAVPLGVSAADVSVKAKS